MLCFPSPLPDSLVGPKSATFGTGAPAEARFSTKIPAASLFLSPHPLRAHYGSANRSHNIWIVAVDTHAPQEWPPEVTMNVWSSSRYSTGVDVWRLLMQSSSSLFVELRPTQSRKAERKEISSQKGESCHRSRTRALPHMWVVLYSIFQLEYRFADHHSDSGGDCNSNAGSSLGLAFSDHHPNSG